MVALRYRLSAIDAKTLRKHYREELDTGQTKATAKVADDTGDILLRNPVGGHSFDLPAMERVGLVRSPANRRKISSLAPGQMLAASAWIYRRLARRS